MTPSPTKTSIFSEVPGLQCTFLACVYFLVASLGSYSCVTDQQLGLQNAFVLIPHTHHTESHNQIQGQVPKDITSSCYRHCEPRTSFKSRTKDFQNFRVAMCSMSKTPE